MAEYKFKLGNESDVRSLTVERKVPTARDRLHGRRILGYNLAVTGDVVITDVTDIEAAVIQRGFIDPNETRPRRRYGALLVRPDLDERERIRTELEETGGCRLPILAARIGELGVDSHWTPLPDAVIADAMLTSPAANFDDVARRVSINAFNSHMWGRTLPADYRTVQNAATDMRNMVHVSAHTEMLAATTLTTGMIASQTPVPA